ncbi:homocysteine-responsive endoplasmic reticulum-resident ubiquitin-like domain member 2 protein [Lytechinus pictus]|uniref:homocysteine-responsive endoplasmic reticulum-resident ubiquitin-like domain member 2 protein n=1 Tax=Lytechinus pictus TaxID=7653 RepID=UPI0030B9F743
METLVGSPLTLVVKAPNQEIGDQTVECFLDWTVRKLKKHLSAVYPTNPNERSQRIIYSGKLLQDNLLLKDVLHVPLNNPKENRCTVHLVCTPPPEELAKRETSRQSQETVLSNNDGLRQRTSTQRVPQPEQPYQNAYPDATSLPSTSGSVPVPQPGVMPNSSMSTAQMQWMQHVYAQQMAAYMQYASMMAASSGGMQAGWNQAYPMTSSPWLPPSVPHPATSINQPHPNPAPGQQAEAAPPPAPAAAAPAPAAAGPPPQRMNVGGGQAGDMDEEGVRRDWLDWTFTLCRFGILLSIVYFYSSIHRFLMVAGAVFVMYLYQAGYFQLRRRQRARPPVTPPQEQLPREETPPSDGQQDDQPEESESSTSGSDDVDGSTEAEPVEPPRPGMLVTVWIFVSTFFTSILPQGPPQQFPAN